jgi:hypothetical protein
MFAASDVCGVVQRTIRPVRPIARPPTDAHCQSCELREALSERSHRMSHAVVINVTMPATVSPEDGVNMLNEMVIPQARSQEGFQNGTWMADRGNGSGMGVVVFDTEDHANAALQNLKPPAGAPTEFVSSGVYEVGAQAQA